MSIRITELDAITSLQSGDYIAVDNESTGTHKFDALNIGSNIGQNIANTYSSSASYAIGQYCLYDNNLYKCTTTISTPEAWNSSHWIQVTVGEGLYEKVDKVSGKGLSTNDFTNEYKQKLGGIEAGAEVNVQANWAETNTSSDSYIQNKPGNATTETSGFMSASDKQKLNDIASGAEVNVQANWTETDSSKDDYIKNKPTIDDTLSTSSTNAVENSAIATAINNVTQLVSDEVTARVNAVNGEATARENADIAINEDIGEINTALETKANIDGSYQEMTVGSAEQLLTDVTTENSKIYTFRTTGGNIDVGDRKTEQLVGGTVAWNQLQASTVSRENSGITYSFSNGALTVSGTATANSWWLGGQYGTNWDWFIDHVYLIDVGNPNYDYPSTPVYWYVPTGVFGNDFALEKPTVIKKATGNKNTWLQYKVPSGYAFDSSVTYKPQVFDLTQMFGSTIADAIYAMEQAEAGSGIAWFKKYFPKPYYTYNAGSLQSVNIASGVNTGFNQWDEEWEVGNINPQGEPVTDNRMIRSKNFIPVLSGVEYYFQIPNTWLEIHYYDASKNQVKVVATDASPFGRQITPNNAVYCKIRTSAAYGNIYNHDICINIRWDGERDGEYEPYDAHIYNYDSSLQLRGIPSLDEFNNLVYDGDVYSSDGTVQRKYGIVDLGSVDWNYEPDYNRHGFDTRDLSLAMKIPSDSDNPNVILSAGKYKITSSNAGWAQRATLTSFAVDASGYARIYNDGTADATAFKTAMSGVYLVYELATPTTEEADPYQNPQIINDWGTEEWVDAYNGRDFLIPPGHNTQYMINLKAKLEMSPNSPDGDGEYIVRQTDGMNEYVPFSWVGEREDLIAGGAQQLISDIYEENSEPYLFRTSGGSTDIGDREYMDVVVGGTVAWNQALKELSATDWVGDGVASISFSDNVVTFTANSQYGGTEPLALISATQGHKYLVGFQFKPTTANTSIRMNLAVSGMGISAVSTTNTANIWNDCYKICQANVSGSGFWYIQDTRSADWDEVKVRNTMHIDLTQMFGSIIADYIYSLEQANAGAGVAFFKSLFPKPYYAYNAGELKSVKGLVSHDMVGFNAWDEEWEVGGINHSTGANVANSTVIRSKNYVPCLPSTTYYFANLSNAGSPYIHYYDADKNFVSYVEVTRNTTFTTPANARYIRFNMDTGYGTTYNHDICINLAWDNSRNGEYEPYELHSYPLDSDLTLRGIPKLDINNNLYYDGDMYESDGTVTRKYGIVDLGSLDWTQNSGNPQYYTELPSVGIADQTGKSLICSKYMGGNAYSSVDKTICIWGANGARVWVYDSAYTSASAFKTAMNGVFLVYPLATSTTETADPYASPQIVNDFGTEEFVIDSEITVPIPVGHNTRYTANLKAKLEMAPDSPNGNGDYIVRQSDGVNTYVPLIIEDALPATPTTNGTYRLIATVTDGEVVLSWESNT